MIEVDTSNLLIAFFITFLAGLATLIGGCLIVFLKKPSPRILSFGLAFAGGAMVYVSLTEIQTKSIQSFSTYFGPDIGFAYATLAFLAGLLFTLILDQVVPNPHPRFETEQSRSPELKRTALLAMAAITAHNFPEGLATFFATLEDPHLGISLAIAIAIHNIPEGIAIALPIYIVTQNKFYAVLASLLSGLAEPVGAAIGYWILAPYLSELVFGIIFGVIGGVMVYLALDELLPTAKKYAKGHETVYGLVTGMAVLAISLVLFKLA